MINNEFCCSLGKKAIIALIVILIVIAGYYKLFYGSNFFADEDNVSILRLSEGNAKGNGWRPDVAFGMSFFYGNASTMHPWSLWSFWPRLFKAKYLAYNLSVLLLLVISSLSIYRFLYTIAPPLKGKYLIILAVLAPLISFSPAQHEFYFQRHWIFLAIGVPHMLILLHSYFKESRVAHLFQGAFIFWAVWFLGGELEVYELTVVCILFSILYYIYYRPSIKDLFLKFMFIHLMELIFVILLGFWILYSMFIEFRTVDYVRDPIYSAMMNSNLFLGFKVLWINIVQSLHAGWFPSDIMFLEFSKTIDNLGLRTFSWDNCFIAFPIIFLLFMSKKSFSFWEHILFWLSTVFYLHNLFLHISPFYYQMMCRNLLEYPLQKFQPAYHCLQLGMLGLFFSNYESFLCDKNWFFYIRKALAAVLSLTYCSLIVFTTVIYFSPSATKGFIADVDLLQLSKTISFPLAAFYLTSVFITGIFIRDKWIRNLFNKCPMLIAILFLMNGIFLSWSVYPLNNRPLVWDIREKENGNPLGQTSRIFWSNPMDSQSVKFNDFNSRWGINEADPIRLGIGYRNMPGFNVVEVKPFTQREVKDFILNSLVKPVGNNPPVLSVRDIGAGHYYRAENAAAFNMSSISHVFTIGQSDVPDNLKLLDKTELRYPWYNTNVSDLCVYKNETAWPYFYLAEWGKVDGEMNLFKPKQQDGSFIDLREFFYGNLAFDYKGVSENILIVTDAWHPFWKAYADGVEIPVFKANGIFKGVKLPEGKHSVVMTFDTSPYRPGIYVSVAAWILFLYFWLYFYVHKTVLKFPF